MKIKNVIVKLKKCKVKEIPENSSSQNVITSHQHQ